MKELGVNSQLERFIKGPWPFIIPALITLIIMRGYPFLWQFWLSLTDMQLGRDPNFIGFQNYQFIFENKSFLDSLFYTTVFLITVVIGQMFFGLLLALFLEEDFPGKNFFRVTFLIPWVVSGVVVGILWQLMFVETNIGLLNALLGLIKIEPVRWLSLAYTARASVIFVYIWKGLGFSMLLISGGLKTISNELLESADIDGASYLQKVMKIKIPLMKDILSVNLIFAVIAALNSYETIYVLTSGGPGRATSVIALVMFNTAFGERNQVGRGAAIGVVLFLLTMIFVLIYIRQSKFGKGYKA